MADGEASYPKLYQYAYRLPRSRSHFSKFQARGYGKTPSAAARTWFDYTSALQVKTNGSNQLTLTLDGSVVGTGATVIPNDTWFVWVYKKTYTGSYPPAGPVTHTLKLRYVVDGAMQSTWSTEVSVVQTVVGDPPATLTWLIPAGCSICNIAIVASNSSDNLESGVLGTGTTWWSDWEMRAADDIWGNNYYITLNNPSPVGGAPLYPELWADPPGYEQFIFGDTTYQGIYGWETVTGTYVTDTDDPPNLIPQRARALFSLTRFTPPEFTIGGGELVVPAPYYATAPNVTPEYFSPPIALTAPNLDVFPASVQGLYGIFFYSDTFGTDNPDWTSDEALNPFGLSAVSAGELQFGVSFNGGPISWDESVLGPVTGVGRPATLAELATATYYARFYWPANDNLWGTQGRYDAHLVTVAISAAYIGEGGGLPETDSVIGPLVWVHIPRRT
jgi:hypothetical protein